MSAQPQMEPETTPENLDDTLETVLKQFRETGRMDHAHDAMHDSLRARLREAGFSEPQLRLLEVNLFGSLSGWMQYVLEERQQGRDAVPDFARLLRRSFLAHCRDLEVDPQEALRMVLELANELMGLAGSFQRHLHLDNPCDETGD